MILRTRDLLNKYGLRPDKGLGQNFLVDESTLNQIIEAAEIQPGEAVLEIGPGLGGLTRLLALKARRVVAVELDGRLLPPLKEVLSGFSNVKLVEGDILRLNPLELMQEPSKKPASAYLVVANIPYYITSALMRHLLEADRPPQRLILTIQREVADRMCAKAGEMSLLSLSVQVYGKPELIAQIHASAFYPSPTVDSAVVRVDMYPKPVIPEVLLDGFFRLAKAGFHQKRKTLRNALAGGMHWKPREAEETLEAAGIDWNSRAQALSIEEWGRLTEIVRTSPPESK